MNSALGTLARIATAGGLSLVGAVGCGDSSQGASASAARSVNGVYSIQIEAATHAGLPRCTSALAGTVAYVSPPASGAGLFECAFKSWIPLRCDDVNAGDVAYGPSSATGEDTLLASSQHGRRFRRERTRG